MNGFDEHSTMTKAELNGARLRDINALNHADYIALLPGWQSSIGAQAEYHYARWCGLEVLDARDFKPLSPLPPIRPASEISPIRPSLESIDPITGGRKDTKPERFDLIPVWPLSEIARVYGWGACKYDDNNWRRGYKWSLSFAALLRHIFAFWSGENLDQESGLSHMAHAAWHCLALAEFSHAKLGTDDRWKSPSSGGSLAP